MKSSDNLYTNTEACVTLRPNNKPTKAGYYFVQRQRNKHLVNSIVSVRIIQHIHYNNGELYVFLGDTSCFPLKDLDKENCLWSDEVIINVKRG